jgi:hypothetical protein
MRKSFECSSSKQEWLLHVQHEKRVDMHETDHWSLHPGLKVPQTPIHPSLREGCVRYWREQRKLLHSKDEEGKSQRRALMKGTLGTLQILRGEKKCV